jgi:ATPase subunit of ABC transporter with duplicated ATPase domains
MIDLKHLTFGAPAAERDIGFGLADYFFESDAFSRLSSRDKTILIGNRGTGKSAIFKILAERGRKSGALVLELNPENYSYEMLCSVL